MTRKLITSIFIALSGLPQLAAGNIAFRAAQSYPVGTAPVAAAAGDFNGDGKLDLAVANSGDAAAGDDGGISILPGNGDGTFQSAKNVSAGKNPGSVAAADLNGDGRVDLVVTNGDSGVGQVGVLLGNGDGTFQPVVDYGAGNGLKGIFLGDFNGDLRPDIVVPNALDGTVSILMGNGDGSFQTHMDYAVGGLPQNVVVTDVNADAKLDLIVPAVQAGVAILLGNGDGTFQTKVAYDPGPPFGPTTVASGDFNGDGKPDLIVDFLVSVGIEPPTVTRRLDLLIGNGDGTFQLAKGVVASIGSAFVSAADFDGDGNADIALPGLVFLPGNGDGTFRAPVGFPISAAGPLFITDLNGDKAPDLLVADQADNAVAVVLNVGTDFSLSASPANPATIAPGQSATSTVSLSLLSAFDNPISLSCSVQPSQAGAPTCSVDPNSVTFDGSGKAATQLTVTAGTAAASLTEIPTRRDPQPWRIGWLPIAGLALAGTGLGRSRSSRRRLLGFVMGCVLSAGLIFQSACGGNSNSGSPKSQTYTVRVTANSATLKHSSTVQLTVR
jgi:hypothetical protein